MLIMQKITRNFFLKQFLPKDCSTKKRTQFLPLCYSIGHLLYFTYTLFLSLGELYSMSAEPMHFLLVPQLLPDPLHFPTPPNSCPPHISHQTRFMK